MITKEGAHENCEFVSESHATLLKKAIAVAEIQIGMAPDLITPIGNRRNPSTGRNR